MPSNAKQIPNGYHTVTPYLFVHGAERLIDFLKDAFEVQERERIVRPDGGIGHAEVRVGDSVIMLAEASDALKPMPSALYLFVSDTDATYQRALQAGATSLMEPADQFHGDRNAGVQDPFGNQWWIATHVEDVPPEELQQRANAVSQP
jgi:PhnB protein